MNFIEIPYRNYQTIIINATELKDIKVNNYTGGNNKAVITYHLKDETITQVFDYEYNPYLEHEEEWSNSCPCNNCDQQKDCEKNYIREECELAPKHDKEFRAKYKNEKSNYNWKAAANIITNIKEKLGVISTMEKLEGEVTTSRVAE